MDEQRNTAFNYSYLDLSEIQLKVGEKYQDLYTRMADYLEHHLLSCDIDSSPDSSISVEPITHGLRNLLALYWLEKIHTKLPVIVKKELSVEMKAGKQLHSLVSKIASSIDEWLPPSPSSEENTSKEAQHFKCISGSSKSTRNDLITVETNQFDNDTAKVVSDDKDFPEIYVKDETEPWDNSSVGVMFSVGQDEASLHGDNSDVTHDTKRHQQPNTEEESLIMCSKCIITFPDVVTRDHHMKSRHPELIIFKNGTKFNDRDDSIIKEYDADDRSKDDINAERNDDNQSFGNYVPIEKKPIMKSVSMNPRTCRICGIPVKNMRQHDKKSHPEKGQSKTKKISVAEDCPVPDAGSDRSHGSTRKVFSCEFCGKSFRKSKLMQNHRRIHTGERPFMCQDCGTCFTESNTLKRHMKAIHAMDKPFQCHVCQMSFSISYSLTLHLRTHTGERPYQCQLCPMGFITSQSMKSHMKVHTGEKPFQCGKCDKKFARGHQLKLHSRIHTGEKPFQCDICQKSFARPSCLSAHRKIHTGEKSHHCPVCRKGFILLATLKRHMKVHPGHTL